MRHAAPKLPLRAELDLPADPAVLHLARSFVRDVASLGGLPETSADDLVQACDEACTNVLEHAFEPGEEGRFTLRAEVNAAAVVVSVLDRGIPFESPANLPSPAPGRRGLGLYLIGGLVDRLVWIRHGKEGKELRMEKRHPDLRVTDRLTVEELAPFPKASGSPPPQEYEVRRLRPEDCLPVARALYRTYGYTYPTEDLYFPERVARLNASGQLLSAVALTGEGEVVGHYALELWGSSRVGECGQAVVIPSHRGAGLLNRMRAFLETEADTLGLLGLFGQPVTSHTLSQQMNESFAAKVCGVTLGLVPRTFSFKAIRPQLPQRETCMLYFKALQPFPERPAHAPARHRDVLSGTYAHIGMDARFGEPEPPSGESRTCVRLNPSWGFGTIRVERAGANTAGEIRKARRELCEHAKAEVVYLELPLDQPGCPALCDAAEEDGFFFAGLGPAFLGAGDALRLQYLNCDLDTSQIQVHHPFGKELLAYVEGERRRVMG